MRVGSLCSGCGGLDLAVGGELAWVCEFDTAPSKVLAHHWPGVPNLGDITRVDWASVEPVDVLVGGYPCQPFSVAGRRKGTADERHIWPWIADAVRVLRPRLCVFENVAGHLRLGFDTVLADLAALGMDARWGLVRASEAGAPHRRERLWIVAHPADTTSDSWFDHRNRGDAADTDLQGLEGPQPAGRRDMPAGGGSGALLLKTPTAQLAINGGSQHPDKRKAGGHGPTLADEAEHLLPTPLSTDGPKGGPGQRNGKGRADSLPAIGALLLGTPTAHERTHTFRKVDHGAQLANQVALLPTPMSIPDSSASHGQLSGRFRAAMAGAESAFGRYAPAVARWEQVLGRPAPAPTEAGRTGPVLSPRFVEWMMGLPDGWVTDPAIGLTRTQQLKMLGNGVVPQQAARALNLLGVARP